MAKAVSKVITAAQFRSDIKQLHAGAWLFYGDENFIKHRELERLREKLCSDGDTAAFHHFIFTQDNYSPDAVMSAVMSPAMLCDFKLIEIYCLPFPEMRKKEDTVGVESFLSAVADSDDTVLILYTTPENFDAGEKKIPSTWFRIISEYAVPVLFEHETSQKLTLWVQKHFTKIGLLADFPECTYLIDTVGHDMAVLSNEIEKLIAYLSANGKNRLQNCDIDSVCPHNKEIGDFAFADAILDADNEKAFYILADYRQKNEAAQVILGSISKIYTDLMYLRLCFDSAIHADQAAVRLKMHPYVAKLRMAKASRTDRRAIEAVLHLCAETDMAIKSSAADEYVLLERLIVRASQYRQKRVFQK